MKALLPIALALLAGCSSDPSMGTGSQTGNSIVAGRISTADGSTLAGARVHLRPLHWTASQPADPLFVRVVDLDTTGEFSFQGLPARTYRLEARCRNLAWSRTIDAAASAMPPYAQGVLRPFGRLSLHVILNDTLRGAKVELYGLDRALELPTAAIYEYRTLLDSLPPGMQTLRIWSTRTGSVVANLPVRIGSDSLSRLEYKPGDDGAEAPEEDD